MRGRVLRVSGQNCLVQVDGRPQQCRMRGRLKEGVRTSNSPVIAGDWVQLAPETNANGLVIERVEERSTHFTRASSGAKPFEQIIAVNIQQLVVVVAAKRPALRPGFIDRAIVSALRGNLKPLVVINKIDLDDGEAVRAQLSYYADLHYPILFTSAQSGEGVDAFRDALARSESAIVGQSGVGKSSLLNCVEPNLSLRTREIMAQHDRGRHTTTAVELYPLSLGGYVADTPGIKELHLSGIERGELARYFIEFMPLIDGCRFRNCLHLTEPDCAVRDALDDGNLSEARYASYARIMESLPI